MNILLLNWSDFNTTSESSYCREVIASFSERFEEVYVFCRGNGEIIKEKNVTYYCGKLSFWNKAFKKVKNKISCIHSQDLSPTGFMGFWYSKKAKVNFYIRCGGLWIYKLESLSKIVKQIACSATQFVALRTAKKIVYNSKSIMINKFPEKSSVVYNGVNSDEFKPLKSKKFEKKLLFVGRLCSEKGLRELCEANRKLKNYALTLVGSGPMEEELSKTFPEVKLLGKKPHNELPEIIRKHDIFVLPSYSEGMPNVVLEAMSCAKPSVVADVGGVNEIITDGKDGLLIQPKSVSQIVKAVKRLESKDLRDKLSKNARKTILKKFNLKKQRKELYETLYGDLK